MVIGFVTCGPSEALVISGCCRSRHGHNWPTLVMGGTTFVLPVIHRVQRISLKLMSLEIESTKALTHQGVAISLIGVAQVKIQEQNEELLMSACQGLIGKKKKEIREIVSETLEGIQRSIIGSTKIEGYLKMLKEAEAIKGKRHGRIGEAQRNSLIRGALAEENRACTEFSTKSNNEMK